MVIEDRLAGVEIGERSRNAPDAIVTTRRQPETAARLDQKAHRRERQRSVALELGSCHARVRRGTLGPEAGSLPLPGRPHAIPHAQGRLPRHRARQIDRVDRRNLDAEIESVEQRSGQLCLVAPHFVRGAAAARPRIAVPTA